MLWIPLIKDHFKHTRGQVFLCSLAFIKRRLEIQKVKSTANASKKIKTNHHEAFCATHQLLSHPALLCSLFISNTHKLVPDSTI